LDDARGGPALDDGGDVATLAEPQWEPARSPVGREVWQRTLRPLAAWIDQNSRELSIIVGDRLRAELPEIFEDPATLEENRASTEAGLLVLAELLERGGDPRANELRPAMFTYARDGAQAGVPLTVLLRGYRIAAAELWRAVIAQLARLTPERDDVVEAIELCSEWLLAYTDETQTLAESFYVTERTRWLRSTAAGQAETIDAILEGRQNDATLAGARLRHDLQRHHVGVLLWHDAAEGDSSLVTLEDALDALAGRLGADGSLVRPIGRSAAAAWLSRREPFPGERLDGVRLDGRTTPGVRAALGEPAAGLPGFRRTHAEAVHARRVATLARRPAGSVTRYGRVAVSAMATVDVPQAQAFVVRELGGLAADDDTARRLAATLRVYLDEQSSRTATATRLGLHENTIRYRIRKAEALLGHPVDQRTLEVRIALVLAGVLGD
jgi:hypothetical protein